MKKRTGQSSGMSYHPRMAAVLKTVHATVAADGTVTLDEPVAGPTMAVLTFLVEEWVPNAETLEAMAEPIEALPRHRSAKAAKAELGILCATSSSSDSSARTLNGSSARAAT